MGYDRGEEELVGRIRRLGFSLSDRASMYDWDIGEPTNSANRLFVGTLVLIGVALVAGLAVATGRVAGDSAAAPQSDNGSLEYLLSGASGLPGTSGPEDGALRLSSAVAGAGSRIGITFESGEWRGYVYKLARAHGSTWTEVALLYSSPVGSGFTPSYALVPTAVGRLDIAFSASGTDDILLPDTLPAGSYRVCSSDASVEKCGRFIVE